MTSPQKYAVQACQHFLYVLLLSRTTKVLHGTTQHRPETCRTSLIQVAAVGGRQTVNS